MATLTVRPELEAMPLRISKLPLDKRGYPVPWFVAWQNGEPEFRAMDAAKWAQAVKERRCWVCGEALGVHLTFTIGPMCALNRTIAEPPSHLECAQWSARNCPFLSRPHMVRREDEAINSNVLITEGPGCPIARNPGATCLWTTRRYTVFRAHNGYLIEIGDPEHVEWYASGRRATRAEVVASIDSGLPLLRAECDKEETERRRIEARSELARRRAAVELLLPVDAVDPQVTDTGKPSTRV